MSACKTNMVACYYHTIVIWKGVFKTVFTQYSFYVIESRVSSNCTYNIHRPSMPEKEVNQKENIEGKDCQKATDLKF